MRDVVSRYWVWRRSDGYVSGTAYPPGRGYGADAFETLLETGDWFGEAVPLIEAERSKPDYPVFDW